MKAKPLEATFTYKYFYPCFSGAHEQDHGIQSHHFMADRWENSGNSDRLYFCGAPKSLHMVIEDMKLKDAYSLEGKL